MSPRPHDPEQWPERIGRYRVVRPLGSGGMGLVYVAHDERLDRPVAVKVLRPELGPGGTADLLREARTAASVTHPNVCQVYDVDEEDGRPFLVMELLEGESLSRRLKRGPLPLGEAIGTTTAMLGALAVLHARGFVHLDLKPSNVFLTPSGLKVLDFGLARRPSRVDAGATQTLTSTMTGTPFYMAPEQIRGEEVDGATDLFSAGALLFELVVGRPPFRGATVIDVLHAVLNEHPPTLAGSPALVALDRVVQRALAKRREERYANAAEMAAALQAVESLPHDASPPRVQSLVRLAVLPFRPMRPDPESDFLATALADAVTTSLANVDSLVVRSTFALPDAAAAGDVRAIAAELDVDVVLTGTLLRVADRVRVNAQLVEAGTGRTTWSQATEGSLSDVFRLQDEVTSRIIDSLPVGRRAGGPSQPVPKSDVAYRLFLRANQLATEAPTWPAARQLYEDCVEQDPGFAPGWAGLGRVLRIGAKYEFDTGDPQEGYRRAEGALQRALALSPDLPVAHYHYAQLETDLGRTAEALGRLLDQARARPNAPELYAGLVLTCRYAGLLDASVAAHDMARALDPTLRTSIGLSWWALGDYERTLDEVNASELDVRVCALEALGRREEALELARAGRSLLGARDTSGFMREALIALLEGRTDEALWRLNDLVGLRPGDPPLIPKFPDGEGLYFVSRAYARFGESTLALAGLEAAAQQGYCSPHHYRHDTWLASVRDTLRFAEIFDAVLARYREIVAVFNAKGGATLLGVPAPDPDDFESAARRPPAPAREVG